MKILFSTIFYFSLASFSIAAANAQSNVVPGANGPITITPLIHSSVQLEYLDTVVQIDPWNRVGLPGAKQADLILITDDVGHHTQRTTVQWAVGVF